MKSLYRLLAVDPGIRSDRVLTMEMSLRTSQYDKDIAKLNFWQRAVERVRALPGVESVALGTAIPLTGDHSRADVTIEGMALPKPGSFPHPDVHIVSPGYAQHAGRSRFAGPRVCGHGYGNGAARRNGQCHDRGTLFPKQDPIGKRFLFGHPSSANASKWVTIVGVVGDTKLYGLANPARLEVYLPFQQAVDGDMNLIVKSASDPEALTSAIRNTIASIDKDQPIFGIATMAKLVGDSVATQRITLVLLGLFSALALTLAAIGIYGVVSYSVAQRTHEIGIRMALGAQRQDVLRLILMQGVKVAGSGVAIGIVASLGLTRWMATLLFSVSAADPVTYATVAVALVLIALLACYIPARRTLRVDPAIALRHE